MQAQAINRGDYLERLLIVCQGHIPRISSDVAAVGHKVEVWQTTPNAYYITITQRFTVADAHIRLPHFYP